MAWVEVYTQMHGWQRAHVCDYCRAVFIPPSQRFCSTHCWAQAERHKADTASRGPAAGAVVPKEG